ncbi:MAG: glycosyltransferase family 2 protein [Clostridiales bacterium]|nr:glycosyltransferase family 2 protein [Clostridiales bacterium]
MLSIVIPCYNEEGNVKKLFTLIKETFCALPGGAEVLFVNDGSTDKTGEQLKCIYAGETEIGVQVITFSRNFGKEAAIYAGLSHAKGDFVCIMDSDLQQRPETVKQMLSEIEQDSSIDCVAAYQTHRNESAPSRALKSCFYRLMGKMCEVDLKNGASDFRLMRRSMVDAVLQMTEYHRFSKGIFSWVGFNTKYIEYQASERESGSTKWGYKKLFRYAFDGIVSFSTFPLKLSTYVGFISAAFSIIYLIIVLIQKLCLGIDVPGYATIVILLLFFGGMQLFCLGILGEYVSKIFIEVKDRPVYIIKEHLGKQDEKN